MADKKFDLWGIMSVMLHSRYKSAFSNYKDGKESEALYRYMTHDLLNDPRVADSFAVATKLVDACEELLKRRYPKLAKKLPPDNVENRAIWTWIEGLEKEFGTTLPVKPLPKDLVSKIIAENQR